MWIVTILALLAMGVLAYRVHKNRRLESLRWPQTQRYHSALRLLAGAVALIAAHHEAGAQGHDSRVTDAAGLYLYMAHPDLKKFESAYTDALALDFIDGVAMVFQWRQIEPGSGVFDWSLVDKWTLAALRNNKKLAIGMIAGSFAPDWLYDPDHRVTRNTFSYDKSTSGVACSVVSQPSAWQSEYLRAYADMLRALSHHFREFQAPGVASGAAYRALRVVKLSGINNTSEELKVLANKPDDGPCHQSDSAAIWAKAGFTPARIRSAFMTIAAATAHEFPEKLLAVAVIHKNAFPPVSDQGEIYTNVPIPDVLTGTILDAAIPAYASRLMVQWNALWQGRPPDEVARSHARGASIGWQMNGFMGAWGGSGCIYTHWIIGACKTPDDFHSILENGMKLGASYIEVQIGSLLMPAWRPAFHSAHHALAGESSR